jgi:hypothetical protein
LYEAFVLRQVRVDENWTELRLKNFEATLAAVEMRAL